jgi:phage shock protein E
MNITPDEFRKKLKENRGVIIDVRTKGEYDEGHLKKTDYHYDILNGDFQQQIGNFEKDKTYYLYCRSGNRSGQAAKKLKENGFENVYNIGGFEDLASAGFETD